MRYAKLSVLTLSAIMFCTGTALAAGEASGAGKKKTQVAPPVTKASVTLDCGGGKTFKISTGSNTGECQLSAGFAACSDGGLVSSARCGDGCITAQGSGSCTASGN
jgi:hypothetical protein